MNKKEYILIGLVVLMAGVYAVCFTDWFKPTVMRIEQSTRGGRADPADSTGKARLGNITFALNRSFKLTSVKVVPLQEYMTNKNVLPVWELAAKKGSDPLDGFAYGLDIPGMTPTRPQLTPDPLQPGVEYRLLVTAGSVKGERDFRLSDGVRR